MQFEQKHYKFAFRLFLPYCKPFEGWPAEGFVESWLLNKIPWEPIPTVGIFPSHCEVR